MAYCCDVMEEHAVSGATIRWLVLAFCAAFWIALGYALLA